MKYLFIFLLTFPLFGITSYTQDQKLKKIYPLGKKIHTFVCKDITKQKFLTIDTLYNYIDTHCPLDEKRYKEALAWYIWDNFHIKKTTIHFNYTKKTKCPVCGMFIYKYPSWATMMVIKNKRYFFDGVKDMLKFYFDLEDTHEVKLYVMDYYSKHIFELHKGYVVLGSDIYGPMGDELIPFKNKTDAQEFLEDHQGRVLLPFDKVDKKTVWSLDE